MINGIIGLSIHSSRRDDGGGAMSAVPTRAAPPSAAYRCHRRRAPASRHPRTRVTRAAAGPDARSTKAPSSPSSPAHVVVVPGFLSGAERYRGMARALELENTFASVTVVPITRDMWFPTLAGADFTPMLDAIDSLRSIASVRVPSATSASWDTARADGSRGCGWATRRTASTGRRTAARRACERC